MNLIKYLALIIGSCAGAFVVHVTSGQPVNYSTLLTFVLGGTAAWIIK